MAVAINTLAVPALRSGGLMLGYGCPVSCRHCAYRAGPDVTAWMDDATLENAMDALASERFLRDIHIGGGEPTLRPDLLVKAIRLAEAKRIRLSYVETNGWFAVSERKARHVLEPLKDAGLNALLLSVSPYHVEGIPLSVTLTCWETALKVFGPDGVFPWLNHFVPMLEKMDPGETHPLHEFLSANGMRWGDPALLNQFPLTPGGRVPSALGDFFVHRPADAFRHGNCFDILTSVDHFHIDSHGYLFTGHCPGIISGTFQDLHSSKNLDDHPVFTSLCLGGPFLLARIAGERHGFTENGKGYISPCHLCYDVRSYLHKNQRDMYPELGPDLFYREETRSYDA